MKKKNIVRSVEIQKYFRECFLHNEFPSYIKKENIITPDDGTEQYIRNFRGVVVEDEKDRFDIGEFISSSAIISIDGNIIQTNNTLYEVKSWYGYVEATENDE